MRGNILERKQIVFSISAACDPCLEAVAVFMQNLKGKWLCPVPCKIFTPQMVCFADIHCHVPKAGHILLKFLQVYADHLFDIFGQVNRHLIRGAQHQPCLPLFFSDFIEENALGSAKGWPLFFFPFPLQSRSKQYDCGDSFHTADCNQRQISAEHSQKIRYFFYHHFAFLLAGTMEPASAEVLFPNRKNPCNF